MVSEKDTPEEQLLRMIEGGRRSASPEATATRLRRPWYDLLTLRALRTKPQRAAGRSVVRGDSALSHLNLANTALWIVLIAVALYAFVDISKGRKQLSTQIAAVEASLTQIQEVSDVPPTVIEPRLEPAEEYVRMIQTRNPFTGTAIKAEERKIVTEAPKTDIAALAEGLVVVGLDRGPQPEALVEDTTKQRTFFLKAGDKIREFTVKEISTRGLVLIYEGEEYVLE